jgi:hypothetical protein
MDAYTIAHNANRQRIMLLIADANAKRDEAEKILRDPELVIYWRGFADGLKRALNVLDGKG